MKKIFFITLSFLFFNQYLVNAQEKGSKIKNAKIGITFSSFGENVVFRFEDLEGAASYNSDYFYAVGINYIIPLNKWLEAETGIEYARHYIIIEPNLPPNIDSSPRKENFGLVNIPLSLRANFLKYFFVNAGLTVGIDGSLDSPIDNQSGIGPLLGVGMKYDFKSGISVFVNPYGKIHSLLSFNDFQRHQRIWESAVRVGLTYNLGKNN
jgi:hypothetical protein